jgi:hypothetical protein
MTKDRPAVHRDCPGSEFYEAIVHNPNNLNHVNQVVLPVRHCDMLAIKLRSNSARFVDAAVLYVDARGGIQMIKSGNYDSDCGILLPPGSSDPTIAATRIAVWRDGQPVTTGIEHIVVLAIERAPGLTPMCYANLTQPTLSATRAKLAESRGRGPQTTLRRLIDAISTTVPGTRGAIPIPVTERDTSYARVFTLDVRDVTNTLADLVDEIFDSSAVRACTVTLQEEF